MPEDSKDDEKQDKVLDNFKFTLYEFFGYFLPGAVFLVALMVLFWTAIHTCVPIPLHGSLPNVALVSLALLAYFLGHLVQALGNLFYPSYVNRLDHPNQTMVPPQILSCTKKYLTKMVACDSLSIPPDWIVRLCDEAVIQDGRLGDRELFVYREGFYRGSSIAMGFLALSLFIRSAIPGAAIDLGESVITPVRWDLATFGAVCALNSYMLCRRVARFSEYRITRVFAAFVALRSKQATNSETPSEEEKS